MRQHTSRLRSRARPASCRPALEVLEGRCLLSVGTLDPAFNDTGKQTLAFPGGSVTAAAVALQSDGKVVVAGTFTGSGGSPQDFAVARFNANGALDTGFGTGGRVTLDFGLPGSNQQASAVAVQADGKIVVGGSVATSGAGSHEFALARLTPAGALDSAFGSGGKQTIDFGHDALLTALAVQPGDQKVVAVGYENRPTDIAAVAARLLPGGSLDASFAASGPDASGSPGKLQFVINSAVAVARAVALQADGKIVLAGSVGNFNAQRDFLLIRYTTAGVRDTSFGHAGWQALDVGTTQTSQPNLRGGDDEGTAVAVQPDGKILVGGSYSFPGSTTPDDFSAARFNPDGTLDQPFGQNGVILQRFDQNLGQIPSYSKVTGVAVDAVGRVILAGYTSRTPFGSLGRTGPDFIYTRYLPNGRTQSGFDDVTFGDNTADQANAVALDAAGRAVLVGSTTAAGGTASFALARLLPPPTVGPGMVDPTTATWYLRNETTAGAPDAGQYPYGEPGWIPLFGGTGTFPTGFLGGQQVPSTIAAFDPSSATWYINYDLSNAPFQYGGPHWIPVFGDWDGNGTATVGVVDPSTMTWYLKNSNSAGGADYMPFQYGQPGDIPVVGDWDGNGTFTVGVFRPSNATWYLRNSNGPGAPDITPFAYGASYMKPVVGDWDGDGKWTVGVYTPSGNGAWLLRNSNTPGAPDIAPFGYGAPTWTPVAGLYTTIPAGVDSLLAAGGEGAGAAALSTGDLNGILSAALGRLQQAGVAPALLGRLSSVTAQIQPLAPGQLGEALPRQNTIVLSPNGAGHGWFVDPTPYQDEEFTGGTAFASSPAAGCEDLLTAVLHELGHLAGLADDSGAALMTDTLPTGTRRTDALSAAFAGLGA